MTNAFPAILKKEEMGGVEGLDLSLRKQSILGAEIEFFEERGELRV